MENHLRFFVLYQHLLISTVLEINFGFRFDIAEEDFSFVGAILGLICKAY